MGCPRRYLWVASLVGLLYIIRQSDIETLAAASQFRRQERVKGFAAKRAVGCLRLRWRGFGLPGSGGVQRFRFRFELRGLRWLLGARHEPETGQSGDDQGGTFHAGHAGNESMGGLVRGPSVSAGTIEAS